MSRASDEQAKLTANFLNSLAVTALSVGVVAPIVALAINLGNAQQTVTIVPVIFSTLFWGALSLMLHSVGRKILTKLDE